MSRDGVATYAAPATPFLITGKSELLHTELPHTEKPFLVTGESELPHTEKPFLVTGECCTISSPKGSLVTPVNDGSKAKSQIDFIVVSGNPEML